MSWWATTVISLGSALVGGLLAGGGALLVGRRDAHAELAREVRTSLGNYYGALLVTVSQLTRMPDPVDVPDPFGELVKLAPKPVQDWWSASQFVSTERKMRQTLGPEPFAAAERVILMHAPLTIL